MSDIKNFSLLGEFDTSALSEPSHFAKYNICRALITRACTKTFDAPARYADPLRIPLPAGEVPFGTRSKRTELHRSRSPEVNIVCAEKKTTDDKHSLITITQTRPASNQTSHQPKSRQPNSHAPVRCETRPNEQGEDSMGVATGGRRHG